MLRTGLLREHAGRGELALRGHVVGGAEDEADALVAERDEVAPGLLDGDGVVAGDAREAEAVDGRVDQDDGDLAVREHLVVVVRGVLLVVEAAREDHAGDLLLEEELDVVGLRDAALGLRAEHRGEPLLGERAADHLGEGREDRVLQLRQDQSDQPRPLPRNWVGRS